MRRLTRGAAKGNPFVVALRSAGGSRRVRPAVMGVMLMLVVIGLTGCLSIKSQGLSQLRVPGLVKLGGVVCGSDYNRSFYNDCDGDATDGTPANVAERDNRSTEGFS